LTTIGQATSYGPQQVWQAAGSGFNDVTSGNNGTCSVSYECTAGVGYDGPSGWGTPDAVSISGGGGAGGGGTTPPTDAGAPPTDAGSGDSCSHDVCSTGASLTSSCDTCAGQVCDNDSYCWSASTAPRAAIEELRDRIDGRATPVGCRCKVRRQR
jgi:hypothetical protein